MRWPRDARGWPMAETSRIVLSRPHRWHVQETGDGPTVLFLHGAGASTHSWRGLIPALSGGIHAVAVDLPGQGFTQSGARMRSGLGPMTDDLMALIADQGWTIDAIVGHSAGAALALTLWERLGRPEVRVVGINASLGTFDGVAGWLFPMLARLLALSPLAAAVVSATWASTGRVERLIAGTGSRLDPEGIELYRRLVADRAHVDATLSMMSQWELAPLLDRLDRIAAPTLLIATAGDRAVPPAVSRDAARRLPGARMLLLPGLGHLAHEEDPAALAAPIRTFLAGDWPDGATSAPPLP